MPKLPFYCHFADDCSNYACTCRALTTFIKRLPKKWSDYSLTGRSASYGLGIKQCPVYRSILTSEGCCYRRFHCTCISTEMQYVAISKGRNLVQCIRVQYRPWQIMLNFLPIFLFFYSLIFYLSFLLFNPFFFSMVPIFLEYAHRETHVYMTNKKKTKKKQCSNYVF